MLCFLEEKKHSWQKKFTTTSHGGHDKFELCLNFYLMLDSRQVWCLRCWGPRRQTSGVGGWDRQEHKSSSETFPSGSSPTPCLWCSCKKGVFLLTSEKASPPSARASSMKAATSGKCREMFCWGTSSSFSPLYLIPKGLINNFNVNIQQIEVFLLDSKRPLVSSGIKESIQLHRYHHIIEY